MKLPFARFIKAHHISRAALTAGVFVAAVVFFVVGVGLRLLWGPVSLGPLKGSLAGSIHDALPGIALDYDQAAVEWNRDTGRVNLVVLGARLYDGRGKVVVMAPKAAIGLAAAPFLEGKFVVKRITLVGVEFSLVHMKNGRLRLGREQDEPGDDIIAHISDLINKHSGQSSSLDSFAVTDARLAIYDEVTGLAVSAPRANVTIRAQGQAVAAMFDSDVLLSGKQSHVTANLTVPPASGPITGDVTVTGMDLRGLGTAAPMFAGIAKVPMTVNASTKFTVTGATLTKADFDISAAGEIPFNAMKSRALHVKTLRLVGHYDGIAHHLLLSGVDLKAREAQGALHGVGDFLLDGAGKLQKIHAELAGRNVALDMPGIFATPVGYQGVTLTADYLTGPRQFEISKLAVTAQGFALEASGTITLNDAGSPGLVAKARIPALPVRTLLHYWPLPVAAGARDWININIFAGTVGPLEAQTNFAPGMFDRDILPEDSLKLTFSVKDIEGAYIKGLTHATAVQGDAVMTGDTFKANFASGQIGPLIASRGTALIPNLHQVGTVGQFGVHVEGAMPDVMALIDMKPLNYPTKFGIDPKTTAGSASADLNFQVPMLADLPVDKVGIAVKADVHKFAVSLGSHTRITDGDVTFEVDNAHLHQYGQVNLADARLNVDWTEDFRTKDPATTKLTVKGGLTEAARAALNIGLTRFLRGTVPVSADITGHRGSLTRADVTVDFTPAEISVPIVNLEKMPGQSATGRIQVNFAPGNVVQDETIRVTGPVLNATGAANFDRTGALTVLNFSSVKMGPLNDLSFQLNRSAAGDDYTLRGHSLDGSKIGRNGSNEAPGGAQAAANDDAPEGHFHINARLDRFAMRDGVSIMPFNLELAGIGNRPSALALSGALGMNGKSAPISASLENVAGGRKVTLTAGDTGFLVRGLFAFESMRGGQLAATVNLPGRADDIANPAALAPDFTGTLTVKDFNMINQPALARLFSAGSLTGLGDLMGGDGMTLEELNLPFTSKNNVISVNNARVVGRAIGASADGYIDRPHGTLALKGSLIPAYGVNSMLSNIPLIGDILASKKGEGIFGVTYSMTGSSDKPDMSVNPLSMLTPGIFRRIFEGHIPTAANAPSNQPATPAPKPAPAQR